MAFRCLPTTANGLMRITCRSKGLPNPAALRPIVAQRPMPQESLASEVGAGRPRANAAITLNNAVKIKSFVSILFLVLPTASVRPTSLRQKAFQPDSAPTW
jgi:hypothetical protein